MVGSVDRQRVNATMLWRLNNPSRNNALDPAMLAALGALADEVERDREIRAVVLTGEGERAFCAGADIAAWGALDAVDFTRLWIGSGHVVFDRLARLPVPVIGALRGYVFGGGLELAAICDLRVASTNAVFALPEATIGVTPGWSGAQRLARLLPQALVREMALTGARIDAERLHCVGFLNELAENPVDKALVIAERIAGLGPRAVETTKLVLNASLGEGKEQALDRLAAGLIAATADKAEGVRSFHEKRKPRFSGS
jgi:enoyl-CoA hydratase